jgi:fatty acid desaturase
MASPMHTTSASSPKQATGHPLRGKLARLLFRKLWLPRSVYEGLPYFYALSGLAALLSALYLPGWTWILPYLILLGAICLHAGLGVLTMRWRFRRSQPPPTSGD